MWEPRPSNSVARASIPESEGGGSQTVGANQKIPTRAELDYFLTHHPIGNDYIKLVTGNHDLGSNATTDEIIQWATHKWGIDTDIIRAEMVMESRWNQHGVDDFWQASTRATACLPSVKWAAARRPPREPR